MNFENYQEKLKESPLFEGIESEELIRLLTCIGADVKVYEKEERILNAGDDAGGVRIVLSGQVQIFREELSGRRTILTQLGPGEMFQEVFACAGIKKSPVSALGVTRAAVMSINYGRILSTCANSCAFHTLLIRNMLRILAQKNLTLSRKMDYLLIRSLRARLAAYLLDESGGREGKVFEIPYDRSGLSDFLNADRSAVSRELGRMRGEGLIDFSRSSFKLNNVLKLEQITEQT